MARGRKGADGVTNIQELVRQANGTYALPDGNPASEGKSTRRGPKDKFDTCGVLMKLDKIEDWYRKRYMDEDVAQKLGISVRTIYNWLQLAGEEFEDLPDDDSTDIESEFGQIMGEPQETEEPVVVSNKYAKFAQARIRGREPVDKDLDDTLWKLALGYVREETFVNVVNDEVKITRVMVEEKPNPAMARWLATNRMPDKYRDKVIPPDSPNDTPVPSSVVFVKKERPKEGDAEL